MLKRGREGKRERKSELTHKDQAWFMRKFCVIGN